MGWLIKWLIDELTSKRYLIKILHNPSCRTDPATQRTSSASHNTTKLNKRNTGKSPNVSTNIKNLEKSLKFLNHCIKTLIYVNIFFGTVVGFLLEDASSPGIFPFKNLKYKRMFYPYFCFCNLQESSRFFAL